MALAPLALEHELVISHGNGPQVGLLALQGSAYKEVEPYPLDVLGAQTEGMIGYLIQQELGNQLPPEQRLASLLTLIEVDPDDPAFGIPPNPSARFTSKTEADIARSDKGWTFKPEAPASDGSCRRRHPSGSSASKPSVAARTQCVVICAGGGGIPVMYSDTQRPPVVSCRR